MKLINVTKRCVIAEQIRVATTLSEKITGLLNEHEPTSLYLKTRFGIHTAGMHFAIDCAILDSDFRVRAMRSNITPGHFYFWNPLFKNVIELPATTLARTNTSLGDILSLEDVV